MFHSLGLLSAYNVQGQDKSVVSVKYQHCVCCMTCCETGFSWPSVPKLIIMVHRAM